ncbi:SurA N-terminal domain-containing protein [Oceanobacillus sp. CF4.6]|uniref:SurA N-terminal domain-containing protein n=1 Tax=Oceanobacillus sp. CF4.6 TaxID=3373080 RepID=UPI003EE585CB
MILIKKWLLSLSIAVLAVVVVACSDEDETAKDNNENAETQEEESNSDSEEVPEGEEGTEQPQMPEPDLEGVPDVVAEVNGVEIPREEFETNYTGQFQQAAMQSQMTGEEVDQNQLKKRLAESMIGLELLKQEADRTNIEATQEDIDQTLDELAKQNGLESKDEFLTALNEQGMDEEEVMSQLDLQVKVEKLIANEAGEMETTDEELEVIYDQFKAQQEEMNGEDAEVPSFEDMKPQLEQQVKGQQEAEAYQTLVEKLREDADVTNYL